MQKFYFRGINKHFCLVEFELDEKMIPNCFFFTLKSVMNTAKAVDVKGTILG